MNLSRMPRTHCPIVALVATANRDALLVERSLRSIAEQAVLPARVVVVYDSRDDADVERLRQRLRDFPVPIEFLNNRRTHGASGAWNSGIDHIARTSDRPDAVHVAILDDDDAWTPEHLSSLLECIRAGAAIVCTPFRRNENGREPKEIRPPEYPEPSAFFVRNPGIQASNLAVRLDMLWEAGCFDEALRACTDRDLCIRLFQAGCRGYQRTRRVTVDHFACNDRPRLSTPGSPDRQEGFDAFLHKHGPLMTPAQRAAAEERARNLFGWEPSERAAAAPPVPEVAVPESRPAGKQLHLVVAAIVDAGRVERLRYLLDDLAELRSEPEIAGLDMLLLENGERRRSPAATLADACERHRRQGLRIHIIGREMILQAHAAGELFINLPEYDGGLGIAPARTTLQTYLYHFARKRPGCVAWIIDDDMRLDPLVDGPDGPARRRLPLAPQILAIRERGLNIAIGRYTGAAPLPALSTVRVQLVDLLWNLERLAAMDPDAILPEDADRNRANRANRRDYYYDLAHTETDRLETPFALEPAFPGETVRQALDRLVAQAERILAGEQVFRPLVLDPGEFNAFPMEGGLLRGGNTFVFEIEVLADVPNLSAEIAGRPVRRSDMLWTLVQGRDRGRRVGSVPTPLYHDRAELPIPEQLDFEAIVDDIRGYVAFNAARERGCGRQPGREVPRGAAGRVPPLVSQGAGTIGPAPRVERGCARARVARALAGLRPQAPAALRRRCPPSGREGGVQVFGRGRPAVLG